MAQAIDIGLQVQNQLSDSANLNDSMLAEER
jgi:hypothetical protein